MTIATEPNVRYAIPRRVTYKSMMDQFNARGHSEKHFIALKGDRFRPFGFGSQVEVLQQPTPLPPQVQARVLLYPVREGIGSTLKRKDFVGFHIALKYGLDTQRHRVIFGSQGPFWLRSSLVNTRVNDSSIGGVPDFVESVNGNFAHVNPFMLFVEPERRSMRLSLFVYNRRGSGLQPSDYSPVILERHLGRLYNSYLVD